MPQMFDQEEIESLIDIDTDCMIVDIISDMTLSEIKKHISDYPFILRHTVFCSDVDVRKIAIDSDFRVICIDGFNPTENEIIAALAGLDKCGDDLNYNYTEPYDTIWDFLNCLHKEKPDDYPFLRDLIRIEELKNI